MDWSFAAQLAVLMLIIILIWAAGVAWIKISDYLELRRVGRLRARYVALKRSASAAPARR